MFVDEDGDVVRVLKLEMRSTKKPIVSKDSGQVSCARLRTTTYSPDRSLAYATSRGLRLFHEIWPEEPVGDVMYWSAGAVTHFTTKQNLAEIGSSSDKKVWNLGCRPTAREHLSADEAKELIDGADSNNGLPDVS